MQPFTFFISYRRRDTAPIALLLKNEIEKRLRFVRVLVDVDTIQPGDQFPDRIKQMIDRAQVTIALIGDRWMPPAGEDPKLDSEEDWVVRELEYVRTAPAIVATDDSSDAKDRSVIPLFVNTEPAFSQFALPPELEYLSELHAESINYSSWPVMIGPLLDRLAVNLKLKARPDQDEYPTPAPAKARTQPLDDDELARILQYDDYEGWYVDNFGDAEARYITKIFEFSHFNEAAAFMSLVSEQCRLLDHHPEWRNVFNHVTVSLTTWDARRRVTIYDLNLALFMNKAAKDVERGK